MENLLILLVILITTALARMVSRILHELGHGVAALLFTRKMVEIFIGSYGDKLKSFQFNMGKLVKFSVTN